MLSYYIRELEPELIRPQAIAVDMDLCCNDFPFDSAWFIANEFYWQDELGLEVRV